MNREDIRTLKQHWMVIGFYAAALAGLYAFGLIATYFDW